MATRRQVIGLTTLGLAAGAYACYFVDKKRAISALREERKRAIDAIERVGFSGQFKEFGPSRFLERWSDEVILRLRRARFPLDDLQTRLVDAGSILKHGAAESEVDALENRLGLRLPLTLREIYLKSNGIYTYIGYGGEQYDLLPVNQVRWLHEVDPKLVEIWTHPQTRSHPSDARYFVYGPSQDVITIRTDYLRTMVCLTPVVDGGAMLLNAALPATAGELEAWDFSVKHPGAIRFRTLGEMLEHWCASVCWNLDYWSVSHGWERA